MAQRIQQDLAAVAIKTQSKMAAPSKIALQTLLEELLLNDSKLFIIPTDIKLFIKP